MLANTAAHTGGLDKMLAQGIWLRDGLKVHRLKNSFPKTKFGLKESGSETVWKQKDLRRYFQKPDLCVTVAFVQVKLLLLHEPLVPWKICHLY